ncbi:MAG: hypothetical protein R1F54_08260 [Candidatus Zeuxoniibacter abyssi]|nr:MAG: hypothetical protein R1F54_08260 [Candidatus Persebacteraceae bacterium AB1(2)]
MEATNLTDKAFLMPNGIYQGDCIALMQDGLYAQSIDMIYADPPYNASHRALSLPKEGLI